MTLKLCSFFYRLHSLVCCCWPFFFSGIVVPPDIESHVVNSNFVSDPCADVTCKEPKTCAVDSRGKAKCACPDERDCPATVNTVCGSDSKTYLNDCVMKAKSCERDAPVYKVMDGYCGECSNGSDDLTSPSKPWTRRWISSVFSPPTKCFSCSFPSLLSTIALLLGFPLYNSSSCQLDLTTFQCFQPFPTLFGKN